MGAEYFFKSQGGLLCRKDREPLVEREHRAYLFVLIIFLNVFVDVNAIDYYAVKVVLLLHVRKLFTSIMSIINVLSSAIKLITVSY